LPVGYYIDPKQGYDIKFFARHKVIDKTLKSGIFQTLDQNLRSIKIFQDVCLLGNHGHSVACLSIKSQVLKNSVQPCTKGILLKIWQYFTRQDIFFQKMWW